VVRRALSGTYTIGNSYSKLDFCSFTIEDKYYIYDFDGETHRHGSGLTLQIFPVPFLDDAESWWPGKNALKAGPKGGFDGERIPNSILDEYRAAFLKLNPSFGSKATKAIRSLCKWTPPQRQGKKRPPQPPPPPPPPSKWQFDFPILPGGGWNMMG
jgi:hypothetical protein